MSTKKKLATRKDTVRFSVVTFIDMKTRLDRMAKKKNTSLSVLINEALSLLLDRK